MIYITSDHAGFELKTYIKNYFDKNNVMFSDLGPFKYDKNDDYTDFAHRLCKDFKDNNTDKGIIICNNGVGVSIVCNRYKNVRAALSFNIEHAKTSREDDNSNILALPAGFLTNKQAIDIVNTWLSTEFSNHQRHINRINKINL